MNNPFPFVFDSFIFPEGENALNGEKALAYVRMRHEDPKGDLGRNNRQRQVVEALLDKGMNMSTVKNIPSLLTLAKSISKRILMSAMHLRCITSLRMDGLISKR